MADNKFSHRRESRFSRAAKNHKTSASSIVESIAQLRGRRGDEKPTRVKILVRKEDLKQVLEAIGAARRGSALFGPAVASTLEQRLNLMRRLQILRAPCQVKGRSQLGEWRPALHSIPEEA